MQFTLPKSTIKVLLTLTLILSVSNGWAQMTDKQVLNALTQYYNNNTAEETIINELTTRGVSPSQLERVRTQVEAKQNQQQNPTNNNTLLDRMRETNAEANIDTKSTNDSLLVSVASSQNDIFGRSMFSNKNLTFQPNLNMPTPMNYQLGAGDEVNIDIWGDSELSFTQIITPDGFVTIPNIGPIYLVGLEIREASAKLKHELGRTYAGLNSGKAYLILSLGKSRSIQVNIMGEVVLPGTYTLSSFASVFHAIYVARGANEIGSLRDIKVFRGGKIVSTIDLYSYLMDGKSGGDILLREGDIVKVEPYKGLVKISGEIKRPMRYEIKEGETISKLFQFAGDFNGKAYKKSVSVTRMGETQKRVYTVDSEDYTTFGMQDGDIISVGTIIDLFDNKVEIVGAVYREGAYAIENNIKTVGDLVRAAEGTRGDALLKRVFLYREKPDLTTGLITIDLESLLAGKIADIPLMKNDRLLIPSEFEIFESRTLSIHGEVKSPGLYPFADSTRVKDLILRSGGLLESASQTRIDVSRRIKDPLATKEATKIGIVMTLSLDKGLFIDGNEDFILEPYDEVIVRRSPGYQNQQNINIEGEVLFPGIYALQSNDERLSSLIKRSGGVTSMAYIKGARLVRKMDIHDKARQDAARRMAASTLKKDSVAIDSMEVNGTYSVGINLEMALSKPGGQEDIVLREGDIIIITGEIGIVKISGAVLFPNAVTYYKNKKLGDYINNAGGYSERAKSKKTYVLYLNGNTSRGKNSKIEPGCEVVVPFKVEKQRLSTGEIVGLSASITSVMAIVFSVINTATK